MESRLSFTILSLFLSFLVYSPMTLGQERTGNIVEYFGKEKIDDIHEGRLVHVFDEGLVLSLNAWNQRSAAFPPNPVFNAFLKQPTRRVQSNEVFDVDYLGEEMRWQELITDSTHTFSDRKLRSGYLYLEYDAPTSDVVLFEGSGHTQILVNGLPREGDHYDFGWDLIPVKLNQGINTFVMSPGRFTRMRARLIDPLEPVMLTPRDLLLPDLLIEEADRQYMGAVRIINSLEIKAKGYSIRCGLNDQFINTPSETISPMMVEKIPFQIPFDRKFGAGNHPLTLELLDPQGNVVSNLNTTITIKSSGDHHKRTFVSDIDRSVQYFSVAPSAHPQLDSQALFLSVHGASVEAVNQANAYKKKDWGYLIAPTNRRPFGFAWEDWGRIDAMEVLQQAKEIYKPDPRKIYLTGHSMGGHGTWYLGATYPDQFAAIAPCAGYPDLLEYRNSFIQRRLQEPEKMEQAGIPRKTIERMMRPEFTTPVSDMIQRAGNPSRTLKLIRNYLQSGVYILHGEIDDVVPTFIAREMRERLGRFHPDFVYYEYPGGTHWYGDHSVDWPPIFDFFKRRTLPLGSEIKNFEFYTASPGVSASSHFITILQQKIPFEISNIKVHKGDSLYITAYNVDALSIDMQAMGDNPRKVVINNQKLDIPSGADMLYLRNIDGDWNVTESLSLREKGPHRYGGFKDAFNNGVVLVYPTGGSNIENEWYYNRASFDAQKFWYRANGRIPMISDVDFDPIDYPDRNIVLYGNKDNNRAWDKLLNHCPIQIENGQVRVDHITLTGEQWGTYFIYPRHDSDAASIGVVSASGLPGMKAAYNNVYLENGSMYPDFLLFDDDVLIQGDPAVKCAGFFGNDWSVSTGEFEWK